MEPPTPAEAQPAPPRETLSRRILSELGLLSLARSPLDVKLLIAQRLVRLSAYGASTLVLVSLLRALGHSRAQAGLFMSLTLAGDVLVSLLLALAADRLLGRRAVLALGAGLMAASGLVFAAAPRSYAVLLAAAVLGVISPSGNEVGPFRAVEESVVADLTPSSSARLCLSAGTAGTALGMVTCGWAVEAATARLGWTLLDAYRAVFVAYAALGVVKLVLALALSPAVEADEKPQREASAADDVSAEETTPLLPDGTPEETQTKKVNAARRWWTAMLPQLSPESKGITAALCLLFALDSFASGLAPLYVPPKPLHFEYVTHMLVRSWVTYYFRSRFDLDEGRLGSVFFTTSLISASSVIVASSLAKRLGNVKVALPLHPSVSHSRPYRIRPLRLVDGC